MTEIILQGRGLKKLRFPVSFSKTARTYSNPILHSIYLLSESADMKYGIYIYCVL